MIDTILTPSNIFMVTGFLLSLYSCVSNDIIQTLGTFLSSTKDKSVWVVWAFTSLVLVATLGIGWYVNGGDVAFGRLDRIPFAGTFYWWHVLPPVLLIWMTRKGIPVATAFLILSIFSNNTVVGLMVVKSIIGYIVAFTSAFIIYFIIARKVEKYFLYTKDEKPALGWVVAKWVSTAFLWSAWLMQDAANLYVYLPRRLDLAPFALTMVAFVALLFVICYKRGGEIQNIVKLKTNTQDIRSATIIDVIFSLILFTFQYVNNIPMSTTWVFIGVLAGREIAMYNRIRFETQKKVYKHVIKDLTKTVFGLCMSIAIVWVLNSHEVIFEFFKTHIF